MHTPVEPTAPKKFRRPTAEVEAMQLFLYGGDNHAEVLAWANSGQPTVTLHEASAGTKWATISTRRGPVTAYHGDWIIRDENGELSPLAATSFEHEFEPV